MGMRNPYYILKGHKAIKADLMTWARWFETAKMTRIVKQSETDNGEISTVFLGLDHGLTRARPILFQTMIFGGTLDGQQERYSTWEEAEAGLQRWLEKVKYVLEEGPA
jgi:hypothetical protein